MTTKVINLKEAKEKSNNKNTIVRSLSEFIEGFLFDERGDRYDCEILFLDEKDYFENLIEKEKSKTFYLFYNKKSNTITVLNDDGKTEKNIKISEDFKQNTFIDELIDLNALNLIMSIECFKFIKEKNMEEILDDLFELYSLGI